MSKEQRFVYWDVYLNGSLVDTISYTSDCDEDYVYKSLVNEGWNPDIVLVSNKI